MRYVLVLVIVVAMAASVYQYRHALHALDIPFDPAAPPAATSSLAHQKMTLLHQLFEMRERLGQASGDEQRRSILLDYARNPDSARGLIELVRATPTDPLAISALGEVICQFPAAPVGTEAASLLREHYQGDEGLAGILTDLRQSESDLAIETLRWVHRSTPHPRVKGQAAYALASMLKERAHREDWRDPSAARARRHEAEELYEEVASRHGDLRGTRGISLAEEARAELDATRIVDIGHVAPEIEGPDTDGRRMRLSDYRGKVVVLSFWGHWCSLCRSMYPLERELVESMRGRPFILLGVNSDNLVSTPQSLSNDGTIAWRSWTDGGEVYGGAIARRWDVHALPDFYIIDAKGVIRHRVVPRTDDHDSLYYLDDRNQLRHRWQARTGEIKEVVEELVREAEREGRGTERGASGP